MNQTTKWIAAAVGIIATGLLMWYFHTIVFYILISAVLAILGKPLVQLLMKVKVCRFRMPKWLAAMITLVAMGAVIVSLAEAFTPLIVSKLNTLSVVDFENLAHMLREPVMHMQDYVRGVFPDATFSVEELIREQFEPLIKPGIITESLGTVTLFVMDFIVAVFSVAFITFFSLKEDSLFTEGLTMLLPKKYECHVVRAMGSVDRLLMRYFVGIFIESLIKLICVSLALYLFGFDLDTAVIIGLVTAVLNVIPYIGPLIGGVIALLIAVLSPVEGMAVGNMLFIVVMVLLIFQLLDNIILQPYIYSSSVKAHPLEIFIVILAAGYIAGIVGMLFAIPAYTVIRVFAKEFFNNFRVVQRLTENI